MDVDTTPPRLPPRDPRGHKGTFGTVLIVGGCARRGATNEDATTRAHADASDVRAAGLFMIGGPSLTALASLRAGAGLARLAAPEPLLAAGLAIAPGATGVPLRVDHEGDIIAHLAAEALDEAMEGVTSVAVGPGLGVSRGAEAATLRCLVQDEKPVIADADALNNLAGLLEFHREVRAPAIFTPHVGEFRRLAAAMGLGEEAADEARREAGAAELARRLGCVIVLKSSTTIVTDGHRLWVHDEPNPVLATAGTGDVLTGVMAGLAAQHYRRAMHAARRGLTPEQQGGLSLYEIARASVTAHAAAARAWRERTGASGGLLATDLMDELPGAIEALRGA